MSNPQVTISVGMGLLLLSDEALKHDIMSQYHLVMSCSPSYHNPRCMRHKVEGTQVINNGERLNTGHM